MVKIKLYITKEILKYDKGCVIICDRDGLWSIFDLIKYCTKGKKSIVLFILTKVLNLIIWNLYYI